MNERKKDHRKREIVRSERVRACRGKTFFVVLFLCVAVLGTAKKQDPECIPNTWPVNGFIIEGFGPVTNPETGVEKVNDGLRLGTDAGKKVIAPAKGKVILVEETTDMGTRVEIDHQCGYFTFYAHLTDVKVKKKSKVKRGDLLGYVAKTDPQSFIYYEIRYQEKAIDPISLMYE